MTFPKVNYVEFISVFTLLTCKDEETQLWEFVPLNGQFWGLQNRCSHLFWRLNLNKLLKNKQINNKTIQWQYWSPLSILARKLNLLLRILHLCSISQAIIAQSSLERISGLFSLASIVIISCSLNFGQDKTLMCFA